MRAIEVQTWGEKPVFNAKAKDPEIPTSDSGLVQVDIIAAGLHHLVRSQAAGKHYTTNPSTTSVPYIPGADGVGTTSDGQLVYFSSFGTGGGFGEKVNLPKKSIIPIPLSPKIASDEAAKRQTAIRIATLFNPAMSSWMAFKARVDTTIMSKPNGFTVLILGATSLSGQLAIKFARKLGAKTIIGVARNLEALHQLDIDIPIQLITDSTGDVTKTDFASLFSNNVAKDHKSDPPIHIDIILDYIYGPAAVHLLQSLPSNALTAHDTLTNYIQIGSMAAGEINLTSSILRSKNLSLKGAGPGSWSVTADAGRAFPELLSLLASGSDSSDSSGPSSQSSQSIRSGQSTGEFELSSFGGIRERRFEDVNEVWGDLKTRTVFVN